MCYQVPFQKGAYANFQNHANTSGRIVDHLNFRPDLPHGAITHREGETFINRYQSIPIDKKPGNVQPFLDLIAANYPVERDQRILLSFFKALVQNPGIKANWCPVIQGVQGCGKTLLIEFVKYAMGLKYSYPARGSDFESQFNSQLFDKTLITIDDIVLKKGKLEEVLKAMITFKEFSCEAKGVNARIRDFPANFIIATNDISIVQKRDDSRRFAALMSAIQTPDDKIKASLTDQYFDELTKWRDLEGFQTVAHYLYTDAPDLEFDFSRGCSTAPYTSTTDQAIKECQDEIETIIENVIAEGRLGFKDGWISSSALNDFLLISRLRHLMPDSKRGKILERMGYIWHPGLRDGQATRVLKPDNKRPRLFIKRDHSAITLTDREAIMTAYEAAQTS